MEFITRASDSFDVVVGLCNFEHFPEPEQMLVLMGECLSDSGCVMASFGPMWFHPLGGHLFSVLPWAYLIFTEVTLICWRANFRTNGARRSGEVAGGLNQIATRRFDRIVVASGNPVVRMRTLPIRRLERLHRRATGEFTTALVHCVLRRSPASQTAT